MDPRCGTARRFLAIPDECGEKWHVTTRRTVLRSMLGLCALGALPSACSGAREPRVSARPDRVATTPPRIPTIPPAPAAAQAPAPLVAEPGVTGFFGEDDTALRLALAEQPVVRIEKGGGGRSLGFKLWLADGTRGYFKPEQDIHYTHHWSELGAYYLDRQLRLGRVPPAVGRTLEWDRLRNHAQTDPRLAEMRPRASGVIRGALIAWVHEGPTQLPLGAGWEKWVRVEGPLVRTPYVPPRMQVAGEAPTSRRNAAERPSDPTLPAALSDLLVFDYLIQNADRWGTENANVRTRGPGGPLMFFDNGAGFWPGEQRMGIMERRLTSVQRFRRSTIDALRAFDEVDFRKRLSTDPLGSPLTESMIVGLRERIGVVLEHVASMQARFGERAYVDAPA